MARSNNDGAGFVCYEIGHAIDLLGRHSLDRSCCPLSGGSRHDAQFSPCSSRGSLSLNYFLAPGFFIFCVLFGAPVSAEDINIYFKTSPLAERLRPFSEPATLSLLATAADGKPLASGWLNVRLQAPRPAFFSTDFPLAEGSALTEMRLPLKAGKAEWKYSFPIRGEYRLFVDVLAPDGTQSSKTFELEIREHRSKWLALGVFTLGLFAVGFIAGRIFTHTPRDGTGALRIIFFALVSFTFPAATAIAQEAASDKPVTRLEIDPPMAGKLARVRWVLDVNSSQKAVLSLAITHVEKGMTVFAVDRIPVEGEYSISFHFVDGAGHRITANAEMPGGRSARTEQVVSVSAVEPPITAMVPTMSFFLAMIAAGLGAGRWSRCNATPS